MKILLGFALIFTFFPCLVQGQSEAALFEPTTISDGGVFGLTLSPDGKNALWVKSQGKRDSLVIMESTQSKGKWQPPHVASFSGKAGVWKDIDPMFSPDGEMVLFQSNRPVATRPDRQGFDIWAVRKLKSGWSQPYHLGNTINSDSSESFASIAENGNIYFTSNLPDNLGGTDIYVAEFKNGAYLAPKNLGTAINTTDRESNPFISPHDDYLLFFSSKTTGLGDVDLYISFKKKGQWTSPKNLGSPINSALSEFCPFVHQKQKRLYFSRQSKNAGRFTENIYSYPFDPHQWASK